MFAIQWDEGLVSDINRNKRKVIFHKHIALWTKTRCPWYLLLSSTPVCNHHEDGVLTCLPLCPQNLALTMTHSRCLISTVDLFAKIEWASGPWGSRIQRCSQGHTDPHCWSLQGDPLLTTLLPLPHPHSKHWKIIQRAKTKAKMSPLSLAVAMFEHLGSGPRGLANWNPEMGRLSHPGSSGMDQGGAPLKKEGREENSCFHGPSCFPVEGQSWDECAQLFSPDWPGVH